MKTYFITGAARGLGLEFSKQLLASGERVIAGVRDPERATELSSLTEEYPGKFSLLPLDVSEVKSTQELPALLEAAGIHQLDVLINNAGVYPEDGPFLSSHEDEFKRCFEVNIFGPMRVTRALFALLKKAQAPLVIHITSKMGSIHDNTSGGHYAYRMSKAALNMFHKSFTVDFPEFTSVVFHPGWVQTDMGGAQAPLTPPQSVKGMLAQMKKITHQDSGRFLDYAGENISW